MAHELTHEDASELLGVYALDALDADEREAVESHLADCGFCRAEVLEHVEVAGLLSSGIAGAPSSVWDRISGELQGTPPPLNLAPMQAARPDLSHPSAGLGQPPIPPTDELSERRERRRGAGVRIGALVAAASVAAAVIGVLGIRVVEDGRRMGDIAIGAHGEELARTIDAAKADPEVVKVELRSTDGALVADAFMLPDGRGYLAEDNLPVLDPDRNYQLWAVVANERISVGVLGSDPEQSAFMANGPVAALAITEEDAGGVVVSRELPLVVGVVRQS
ncbi:MAG TPA: anti-sigma factor [Acidimicrobiales bacterium]|nr:anti-sigma factor [Acidimicrobiales bacterium]